MRMSLKITTGIAALALPLALSFPATAQVLGGTGSVGAQIGAGVTLPQTAPLTDQVGRTARDTVGATGDTVRQTGSQARDTLNTRPNVSASGEASSAGDVATGDLDVSAGAMVHGSDGNMLGSVVRLTRDSAGRAETLVVRSADGVLRTVPASGVSVKGDAVVTTQTSGEFSRSPVVE